LALLHHSVISIIERFYMAERIRNISKSLVEQ